MLNCLTAITPEIIYVLKLYFVSFNMPSDADPYIFHALNGHQRGRDEQFIRAQRCRLTVRDAQGYLNLSANWISVKVNTSDV